MREDFLIFLKMYRESKSRQWRARNKNPRLPKTLHPTAAEEVYTEYIRGLLNRLVDYAHAALPRVLQYIRKDGIDEDFDYFYNELEDKLVEIYGASFVASVTMQELLRGAAQKIKSFAETGFARQTLVLAGIPYNPGIPNWEVIRSSWELTNYSLIKSLSTEYIDRLNKLVLRGYQSGWTMEMMTEEIGKLDNNITRFRASLLARDQIGKLNNKITKVLHMSTGINGYLWTTSRDEKVRGNPQGLYPRKIPSHWEIDYKICKWEDPTVYMNDLHQWVPRTAKMPVVEPGMEIACRCTAGPIAIELIEYVDAQIKGETL